MIGKDAPEWLPLAFRTVPVAGDADEAGDVLSQKLINVLRLLGAKAIRIRPQHGKDWSEILECWGEKEIKFQFINNFLPFHNQIEDYPKTWEKMAESLSIGELDATLDAIKEREAIPVYEGYSPDEVLKMAEISFLKNV